MQCKMFSLPVGSEQALDRERKLNEFLGANNVKRVFASLANQPEGTLWSVLFFYEEGAEATERAPSRPFTEKAPASTGTAQESSVLLSGEQVKSIIALKKWRADQAAQENVPLYMVAQNKWLEDIVRLPVRSLDDLTRVRGLGEWRVQKYGPKIIEVLNAENAGRRAWPASSHSAANA